MTIDARRRTRGLKARRDGRLGELLCAFWLILKGYRILSFRVRTPQAEIDVLAFKSDVVAVVEVKRRTQIDAALDAVTPRQRDRLRRAARALAARRPDLAHAAIRLDLVAFAPGRWPRHIPDAWRET